MITATFSDLLTILVVALGTVAILPFLVVGWVCERLSRLADQL